MRILGIDNWAFVVYCLVFWFLSFFLGVPGKYGRRQNRTFGRCSVQNMRQNLIPLSGWRFQLEPRARKHVHGITLLTLAMLSLSLSLPLCKSSFFTHLALPPAKRGGEGRLNGNDWGVVSLKNFHFLSLSLSLSLPFVPFESLSYCRFLGPENLLLT